ncbi:MAG TPA: adenylate/guanylate cyclase domain-containing protein [Aliidongia sp.]|uniref:adenylate/guanylate cyclase domain-containing protein n=1 Tax=Aliidongia sp. TaxID=1914230 RepID=UPI002DDD6D9B|nr:adenylate/guanylate cyclase domain-containing protein [Aliidongia sp.]HEV2676327.1 adenylate/guanylate cyclase domain-containing protein [Aliidongia sp.]
MSAFRTLFSRLFAGLRTSLPLQASVIVLVAVIGIEGATQVGFVGRGLDSAEEWSRDLRLTIGNIFKRSTTPHPEIVVVTITESVLDAFKYRSPVDRQFLSDLLDKLAAKHVQAIGVDVLLDRPTEPDKDAALRHTLRTLPVPVVMSFVEDPRLLEPEPLKFLKEFVPPEERGMANIPFGKDNVVRSIYPGEFDHDGHYIPGLARAILGRIGIQTPDEEPRLRYLQPLADGSPPFTEIEADTVEFVPEALLAGKIVLVGADLSITDRHLTPFSRNQGGLDGEMAGVIIHAHGLAQLLDGKGVKMLPQAAAILLLAFMAVIGTTLGRLALPTWGQAGIGLGLIALFWAGGFVIYGETELFIPLVDPTVVFAAASWLTDLVIGREMRQQRNFVTNALSRIVSHKVVDELLRDPSKLSVAATRREMTYLFTDVAGFTTLAESITSDQLSDLLNHYLQGLCDEILRAEGTVCRFIGDAVFALWSAPIEQPDHAARAVACALAIDAHTQAFRHAQKEKGLSFGKTRIGVHSGDAMVGFFGANDRMEYTALGDNVNASSRLESLNKFFGTRIAISEATALQAPDVPMRLVANVIVKGKSLPMKIYEPLKSQVIESGYAARYAVAYAALEAGSPDTPALFEALAVENPDDGVVSFHLERLRRGVIEQEVVLLEK